MRFELRRLVEYTDSAILEEVQRVAASIDAPVITRTEFTKRSRVGVSTINRHFGSWEQALREAGLAHRLNTSNRTISAEEIVIELRRVSDLLGTTAFSRVEFVANARFTDAPVRRVFGTWHKAMRAAGLGTNPLGRRYTDEECFENLLTVWTHHGRAPMYREMGDPPSLVGPKAYITRFGTWTRALHAFVGRVNADTSGDAEEPSPVEAAPAEKQATARDDADIRDIKLGLRYEVLRRDRFRCVLCGRSPATQVGIVLHVDHIVPVARGGKTVADNLRSACGDCNLGKGSKREDLYDVRVQP